MLHLIWINDDFCVKPFKITINQLIYFILWIPSRLIEIFLNFVFSEKNLKETGEWLEDEELNAKLAEVTKDNPDLLQLLESNSKVLDVLIPEYIAEKEAHKNEVKYFNLLQHRVREQKWVNIFWKPSY